MFKRCVVVTLTLACTWALLGCAGPGPVPPPPPTPPTPPRPPIANYIVYYVRAGDTLVSIGRAHGVPWPKIEQANTCTPTALRIGQPLLIPLHERAQAPQPPPPKPPGELPIVMAPKSALHRGKPKSRYWWPVDGRVTRRYLSKVRGFAEPGIGLSAAPGAEVCSIAWGRVICCVPEGRSPRPGWGNVVAVRHSDGMVSWYGYLGRISVEEKQQVGKGAAIGAVGSGGAAGRAELAFRLFKHDRPVDPTQYMP